MIKHASVAILPFGGDVLHPTGDLMLEFKVYNKSFSGFADVIKTCKCQEMRKRRRGEGIVSTSEDTLYY